MVSETGVQERRIVLKKKSSGLAIVKHSAGDVGVGVGIGVNVGVITGVSIPVWVGVIKGRCESCNLPFSHKTAPTGDTWVRRRRTVLHSPRKSHILV